MHRGHARSSPANALVRTNATPDKIVVSSNATSATGSRSESSASVPVTSASGKSITTSISSSATVSSSVTSTTVESVTASKVSTSSSVVVSSSVPRTTVSVATNVSGSAVSPASTIVFSSALITGPSSLFVATQSSTFITDSNTMSSGSSGMTVSAIPSSVPLLDSSGSSSSFTTATPTSSTRISSLASGTSKTDVTSMTNEPSSSSSLSTQQDRTSVTSQETQTIAPGTAASAPTKSSSIEVEPVQTIPAVSPIASLSDADTTLSTSISVTMTSGDTTITTVTSISVPSGAGGSAKTLTSVFANPTNAISSNGLRDWTFWDNRGAIAGVFVTVALTVIASLLGLFFCCRRRRRRQAQRDANLSRGTFRQVSASQNVVNQPTALNRGRGLGPYARDDPQRGLMAPSITSGGSVAHDDVEPARHSYLQRSSSEGHTIALGLTDMLEHASDGPLSDRYRHITVDEPRIIELTEAQPEEIVTFSDHKPDPAPSTAIPAEKSSPSPTPSSPSIYPPSLSPVQEKDEDDYLFYERETQRKSVQHWITPPPRAHVTDIDSQNPFSNPFIPLNDATVAIITPESCPPRIQTGQAYMPLTPPDSSLGHSPLPSSPVTPQSSELERETRKHSNPFSNAFLGRPVLGKIEPLPRPKRSLLRMPASDVSLNER